MEAIVLAGGLGTRLRDVVSDVPKAMAPINETPFLKYIMEYLLENNIEKVILAVGYKWEIIRDYFGEKYKNLKLEYSIESEPLGTGGAIKKALNKCSDSDVFIINGDTYFNVDLKRMLKIHKLTEANLTIATKLITNFERYGTVVLNNENKIIEFKEKKFMCEGNINGGIYICNKNILDKIKKEKFSFENEYMEYFVTEDSFFAFMSNSYFIDIGIPEDYVEFKNYVENK